jgi:hypothetical protein
MKSEAAPMRLTAILAVVVALFTAVGRAETPATRPATQPAIDPVAEEVLRESCQFLAQTKAFTVHAEIWKDEVLPSGHKIQVTRSEELELRRPDRLHVEQRAHHKGRSIWYDGKTVTVMDREQATYGVADAPATIDQTLDVLAEQYGITVPLEDLAVADPYASAIKNVNAGGYFGDEPVLGVQCRHIGFSTESIDWQLWVADGVQPLPQKLVITYKNEEQSPQYIAIFSKWSLTGRAADLAFEFIPPRGSERVPLVAESGKDKPQANHETDHR